MKIIKRNGSEEIFDNRKIVRAVTKADIKAENRSLTDAQIEDIAEFVEFKCNKLNRAVSVEEIQDMVENQIMATGAFDLARRYVRYRYKRSLVRKANTTDNRILSLIECNNEDVKQENSNKNPAVNSVQRDYMAGEVSRDLTQRMLLPEDIVEADKQGIIHFHDSDYYAQHMHNCDLVNLEDMLQNGTVISGTMIEKKMRTSFAPSILADSSRLSAATFSPPSFTRRLNPCKAAPSKTFERSIAICNAPSCETASFTLSINANRSKPSAPNKSIGSASISVPSFSDANNDENESATVFHSFSATTILYPL